MLHIFQIAAWLPLAVGQTQPAVDSVARWVGYGSLFGVGVTLIGLIINFIWDYYKFKTLAREREQDRAERLRDKQEQEERNKERVEILETGIEPDGETATSVRLKAKLFNPCDFSIPVLKVELRYGERPDGSCALPLVTTLTAEMPTASPDHGSVVVATGSSNSIELGPRKSAVFYLPGKHRSTLSGIKARPEQVWIAVYSHIGEIGRVSGDSVLTYLQVMVRSVPT